MRLHPGVNRKSDATPKYFQSSAPEHAAYEWRTPGADGIFTYARALTVPETDQYGRERVWETFQTLRNAQLIPSTGTQWLDITDGTHFRWWLWICNLQRKTRDVIGIGVCRAYVSMRRRQALFKFVRLDGSESLVLLSRDGHTRQFHVDLL